MKFELTGDKMVIVNGVIVTIKSGEFETDCKATCEALTKAKGVKQVKASKKDKK